MTSEQTVLVTLNLTANFGGLKALASKWRPIKRESTDSDQLAEMMRVNKAPSLLNKINFKSITPKK